MIIQKKRLESHIIKKNRNIKITCCRIIVDCTINDPVDVRAGGPQYLGFNFFVNKCFEEEMKKFIESSLKELGVPLIRIYAKDTLDLEPDEVWDKQRILHCIVSEADYLIKEAKRDYKIFVKNK